MSASFSIRQTRPDHLYAFRALFAPEIKSKNVYSGCPVLFKKRRNFTKQLFPFFCGLHVDVCMLIYLILFTIQSDHEKKVQSVSCYPGIFKVLIIRSSLKSFQKPGCYRLYVYCPSFQINCFFCVFCNYVACFQFVSFHCFFETFNFSFFGFWVCD